MEKKIQQYIWHFVIVSMYLVATYVRQKRLNKNQFWVIVGQNNRREKSQVRLISRVHDSQLILIII
jgi:2-phosphoglycerate kinase